MKWKPIGDQVLLKEQKKSDKTASGLIIMTGMDDYSYADVIVTGDGLFTHTGDRIPVTVKPGQVVLVHANNLGDHKKVKLDGEEYILIRESEIAMFDATSN
jgi:co-chaperonin GroES (HSP10)